MSAAPLAPARDHLNEAGVSPRSERRWLGDYLTSVPERLLVFQFVAQVGMLIEALSPLRQLFRIATFGSSGLLLVWFLLSRRPTAVHPSLWPAYAVVAYLCCSLLHPETNTLTAALAQVAMYVAILAPLVWVPRTRVSLGALRRVLILLLAFHALSSLFGVLQASFPGRFMPNPAFAAGSNYEIDLASGERVLRPMGLTDTPGGAATSGFYAVLLGAGFLVSARARRIQALSGVAILLGMFCLYLAQSRSRFLLTAICVAVFLSILAYRGQLRRFALALGIGSLLVVSAFVWAQSVGGKDTTRRLGTLATTDPAALYSRNRGYFLTHTFEDIVPEHPLGAGLGRWGMMYAYFGNAKASQPIFAEIQITGWAIDGGLPLLLLYGSALLGTLWVGWRLAVRGSLANQLWLYAALIFAYDIGALAWCFSYPVFMSQMGLELWLLNALLFAAYVSTRATPRHGLSLAPWEERAHGFRSA